jgi:protocatechuate 3,4-dioxygenase beta subunit
LFFLLAVVSFVVCAAALHAQEATEGTATGTIQGTVLDEDGIPVEGARITYSSQ